jgi:methyltransferase-like protein
MILHLERLAATGTCVIDTPGQLSDNPSRLQFAGKNRQGDEMADMSRYVDRGMEGKVVTRRIANETVIVPMTANVADLDSVYTLNEVGSFIWERLDGQQTAQAIAEAVAAEFDVALEQAVRDVDELLIALEAKGLAGSSATRRRDG